MKKSRTKKSASSEATGAPDLRQVGVWFLGAVALAVVVVPFLIDGLAFEYAASNLEPRERTASGVEIVPEEFPPSAIIIPSLGIEAPVVEVGRNTQADFTWALRSGVVHYPDTAGPGELGNMYLFGHSSDIIWSTGAYKDVFASLPYIEIGAEVFVTNEDAVAYRYRVLETKVVQPTDTSVLDQGDGSYAHLSIQTSYPVGTALKRFIVIAEFEGVE